MQHHLGHWEDVQGSTWKEGKISICSALMAKGSTAQPNPGLKSVERVGEVGHGNKRAEPVGSV